MSQNLYSLVDFLPFLVPDTGEILLAMASNSREARRQRILERGSDRLAFITGQINAAPSPPPSDSASISQSLLRPHESLPDTVPLRDQIRTDRKTGFTSQQNNISEAARLDNEDHIVHQSRAESPQPQKQAETLTESPASDFRDTRQQQSPATSTAQTPSAIDISASQAFISVGSLFDTITPTHIVAAIDASERERMFSALVIALLVVLSHLGFSSLGNMVSFRPVFLLLLTDATIVLGRVLLSSRGNASLGSRGENAESVGIADQVGNALETVMMMKKIMDTILMDFSLYAVILISGLLFLSPSPIK